MDSQDPDYSVIAQTKKWYKTPGGIVFLAILGLIFAGVLIFMSLVGYYLWQVKYGDTSILDKNFEEQRQKISWFNNKKTNVDKNTPGIINDWQKYIYGTSPIIGNAKASVTVLMFIDFECPYCKQEYPILKEVIDSYSGAVKFVFKQFPLVAIHPNALGAANAAVCANAQGKFWNFYNGLFQGTSLNKDYYLGLAQTLGLDQTKFNECLVSNQYQSQIEKDVMDGEGLNLQGTPSFLVNGELMQGAISRADWDKIILKYLKK